MVATQSQARRAGVRDALGVPAAVLALAAYHLSRRNLLMGVSVGVGVIMAITAARGA